VQLIDHPAPNGLKRYLPEFVLVLVGALILFLPLSWSTTPHLIDFKPFWCAGRVLASGADPYRQEPLATCEFQASPPGFFRTDDRRLAVPAPFPPLTLAFFRIFSSLPYGLAAALWSAFLIVCSIIVVRVLSGMLELDPMTITACLALSLEYVSLNAGEIVPIALAAIVIAADAAARGKPTRAALAAGFACLSPNLALPAIAALMLGMPSCRLRLLVVLCVLAIVDFASGGFALTREYLREVLPAQASMSALGSTQFSTTSILAELGMPIQTALTLGSIWLLTMLGIGIFAGQRLAEITGRRELLVFIPTAFSVIGGPHVHIFQIAAAVPAALVLYCALPKFRRSLAVALMLLAVPWIYASFLGRLSTVCAIAVSAFLCLQFFRARPFIIAALSCGIGLALMLIASWIVVLPDVTTALARSSSPSALAQESWGAYLDATRSANAAILAWGRVPTWSALVILVFVALRATSAPRKGDEQFSD
jgi:hypothetical protein